MKYLIILLLVVLLFYYLLYRPKRKTNKSRAQGNGPNKTYVKWVGGTLGWAFGGPIGALLGFAFGKMYEDMQSGTYAYKSTQPSDFNVSLLVLTAAVMKADGTVKRSELDFVKGFFLTNFGKERAEKHVLMLREILKQDIPLSQVGRQINQYMDYASRLQLMHYLFGVALADGLIAPAELQTLTSIGGYIGLSPADFNAIKAMFLKETDSAYKILEIDPNASNEEIKKAYREMALKHHPDKVAHLGDDVQKAAEEKFQKVNVAYNQIKKERGF